MQSDRILEILKEYDTSKSYAQWISEAAKIKKRSEPHKIIETKKEYNKEDSKPNERRSRFFKPSDRTRYSKADTKYPPKRVDASKKVNFVGDIDEMLTDSDTPAEIEIYNA